MNIPFSKYQGTGNDFIMIDNRSGDYDSLGIPVIQQLCDRRFGIGADGLIKINRHPELDFEVDYYNADGSKSFCGNGARCSVAFASTLGLETTLTQFMAIDGEHEATLKDGTVSLLMSDVNGIELAGNDCILHTGSPHFIRFTAGEVDVYEEGRAIRYSDRFAAGGINVNFVKELGANSLRVLTYERGVEGETYSCGTGVTAAALAYAFQEGLQGEQIIRIETKGGNLQVRFNRVGEQVFTSIYLIGPAAFVFAGTVEL